MGVAPFGVTVTVFTGPAAMYENHTSLTGTVLQVLVVFDEVALIEDELMHTVPLAGMITGCAEAQLLLAGCANRIEP